MTVRVKLPINAWIATAWEDYLKLVDDPDCEKVKEYYYKGRMRLETMAATGSDHSNDQAMILFAVNLYAVLKQIRLTAKDNCTYRKTGIRACQPDISYYIGDRARIVPWGTSIVDLDRYPAPDLAIEVSVTSLFDDLGTKRALYEELGVREYWIVNVKDVEILAYKIGDRGSHQIDYPIVLPGLSIAVLEAALRQSRDTDQSQIGAWLINQFQA